MAQTRNKPARAAASAAPSGADLNPLPQAEGALVPQAPPPDPDLGSEPALDAHGFDPADYKWVPVRRKPRKDGWTPQRQQDFISALAESGCVEHAAIQVRMTVQSCYRLRRSPGGESFAAAWDLALQHAAHRLLDMAFDRAFRGSDEPVFDREGRVVGRRHRQNDRLTMFLLRAYMPDRFRHAHRDWRAPDEALPPPAPPIGELLARLQPVPVAEPHTLMEPEELEDAVLCADLLPGQLPSWHRGRGDDEPPLAPSAKVEAEIDRLLHGDRDRA
jgi:hypothetical protein